MKNSFICLGVGLVLMSGVALADADGDLTNPSTTGTEAMEQPSSQIDDAGLGDPDGRQTGVPKVDGEAGLGTMGAGNRGTTGAVSATTGTESIDEDDEDTDR